MKEVTLEKLEKRGMSKRGFKLWLLIVASELAAIIGISLWVKL